MGFWNLRILAVQCNDGHHGAIGPWGVRTLLSKLAKIALVVTATAPVFLTLAVISAAQQGGTTTAGVYAGVAIALVGASLGIIYLARAKLERMSFEVTSLKTADSEVVSFFIAYLLPLVADSGGSKQPNPYVMIFVVSLFLLVVWSTHSYHFNPVLGFLGFHFYEVSTEGNITYVLMTRRSLRNTRAIKNIVQLTEYMVLDAD